MLPVLLALLHTSSATLTLAGGVQIPIGALGRFPNVLADVVEHAPPMQTVTDLMPIVEAVSDLYFPGLGIGEAIVFYVVTHQKPYTKADLNRWWTRADLACASGAVLSSENCGIAYGR